MKLVPCALDIPSQRNFLKYQTLMASTKAKTNRGDQARDPSRYRRKSQGRTSSVQFPSHRKRARFDRSVSALVPVLTAVATRNARATVAAVAIANTALCGSTVQHMSILEPPTDAMMMIKMMLVGIGVANLRHTWYCRGPPSLNILMNSLCE
jgi:hypothetical protein